MSNNKNLARQLEAQELRALHQLLLQWVRWRRRWRPHLGYPRAVPYLDGMKPGVSFNTEAEDYDEAISRHEMKAIDKAMAQLEPKHRHALQVVYLREEIAAVFRSARMPMTQVRALCSEAEILLIPLLRRQDVRL